MQIRTATPADAPAVVALRAVVYPYLVRSVASTRQMIAEPVPNAGWLPYVAELDGRVVGWVTASLNTMTSEPAFGEISLLHVHPDHRGNGIGTALLDTATAHLRRLGASRARAWAQEGSLGFARRHGFTPGRQLRYAALELSTAPVGPVPAGVRLRPLSELEPEAMYEAYVAAAADEPGDVPGDGIGYQTWRYEVWDNLGLDRAASVAAVADSADPAVLAFTLVKRDGERMWSDMTATRPEHRGRGLARAVKVA
ncbi:GNAT family N-acetyltransferase, partial [Micromonospora zhanjiangensis]